MHKKTFEMIILVYLLSVFSIPSSLGLYKNTSTSSETINTADWQVALNQTGISDAVAVTAGGNGTTWTLRVSSNSEVDTIYTIIVRNVPNDVQVKLGDGPFKNPDNNVVTFPDAGTILYTDNPKQKEHIITFKASNSAALVNNQPVTIDVDFRQAN